MMDWRGKVRSCWEWGVDFVLEKDGSRSSARLCAIACCVVGLGCAIGTLVFAFKHPDQASSTGALIGVITALIGGGAVALINRTPSQ